ncbi:unnamed protein product [Cuscuta epithymum]|uniref:Uncharacterized protein n=1 Tax=Cuscuta epithymum TaxID=186058 RepID=A0AAV0G043_9ASTE|nr:unnamed protein product [Cuscuta epithymum]
MRVLQRFILTRLSTNPDSKLISTPLKSIGFFSPDRLFSSGPNKGPGSSTNFGDSRSSEGLGWDTQSSWSIGLTKEHFDGEVVGKQLQSNTTRSEPGFSSARMTEDEMDTLRRLEEENRKSREFVKGWDGRFRDIATMMKQVMEPGARGSYLKDYEKTEMYKKHKENPGVYTIEKLAKEYRIMRQRVHAILYLKGLEEEEEKKLGRPIHSTLETFIDNYPEFFNSHDREFHVATLPYKPDFKVMPEGWDGTTRDPDEVHYEISMKEDEMLYQEFVQRFNFNKMKMENKVKCHKYSRIRPAQGWNFTVEKLGSRGKRGNGGGWKFVSIADGSTRPLNDFEKMFVKRETPRRRRKILP